MLASPPSKTTRATTKNSIATTNQDLTVVQSSTEREESREPYPRKRSAKMLLASPFVSPLGLHPNGGGPATAAMRPVLTIQAAKQLTGRVVTTKADKTVGVEVVRLAPHPKYKRRERIKKKYQAHDPDNQFKVGDVVDLRRSRPISKTKHFLAVPLPPRDTRRKSQLLPPLQSQAAAAPQEPPPPSE